MSRTAQICISVCEATSLKAAESAARAAEWADLVEIRADFLKDLDLDLLFRNKSLPTIFTLRSREEGGVYQGPERQRLQTIVRAAQCGADYVDVENSAFWRAVLQKVPPDRVILSSHNFEETPAHLEELLESMVGSGAGILKIAVRARCLADNLRLADLLGRARQLDLNLCVVGMGREGWPSRILGPAWGSWMTFASLPGGEATAEGQFSADVLSRLYRIRSISHDTRLYGVLGKPLAHSLSPHIHNAAFAARGEDAVLLPLEAADFDDFLRFHAAVPLQGVAVTLPYKAAAFAAAHSISVAAEQTTAVNTLLLKINRWHGENTDVEGFLRPLKRRVRRARMRAVVLGAGGAARAVIHALRSEGSTVCVVARDESKAQALAQQFHVEHASWAELENLRWDLLVNATPVGMFPAIDQSPVPVGALKGEWVFDLIYNPAETRLLKDAAQHGCRTISGVEMFLGQAWKQQCLWCGTPPPEEVMESAVKSALAGEAKPGQDE